MGNDLQSIKLLFEAMDRNKDGTITREEFMSFFASGQAKRAAGGGLGWQILRNKMPWVLEAEELVGEWVRYFLDYSQVLEFTN